MFPSVEESRDVPQPRDALPQETRLMSGGPPGKSNCRGVGHWESFRVPFWGAHVPDYLLHSLVLGRAKEPGVFQEPGAKELRPANREPRSYREGIPNPDS